MGRRDAITRPGRTPRTARSRTAFWRAVDWLVASENPAGTIYGLLAIGALLAAESGRHETHLDTLLSAGVAACGYWLLHSYATVLGERLRGAVRLDLRTLATTLSHDRALLRGAAVPLVVIVITWLAGADQELGVRVALWTTVACIFVFELTAGLRSGAAPHEVALEAGIGLLLGLALLALRLLLH
ncbi:MAG TPA: hypothetical protein VFW29_10460 [Solirubrobacteraceae bacterium]|nr:hypothetical protein [Solirubrobacteraceae bacterium]